MHQMSKLKVWYSTNLQCCQRKKVGAGNCEETMWRGAILDALVEKAHFHQLTLK